MLGLRSGRERKLRSLSTRRWSEYAVAVWARRYLFSRSGRGGGIFVSRPLRRIARGSAHDLDLRGRVGAFIASDVHSGIDSIRVVYLRRGGGIRKCVVATGARDLGGAIVEQYGSLSLSRRFVYWVFGPVWRRGGRLRAATPAIEPPLRPARAATEAA